MDMTDDHIDHMENYRHNYQDHLVNRCQSVFPQWQPHPHSPGCSQKILAEQNVDFFFFFFFKKRMGEVVRRCRLLRCNQMMAAFLHFAFVPNALTHLLESCHR